MDEAGLQELVRYYQQKHADEVLANGQLQVALRATQVELQELRQAQAAAAEDAPADASA